MQTEERKHSTPNSSKKYNERLYSKIYPHIVQLHFYWYLYIRTIFLASHCFTRFQPAPKEQQQHTCILHAKEKKLFPSFFSLVIAQPILVPR